ncbi:hypothetical protein D3C83_202410 [compost metagenome]
MRLRVITNDGQQGVLATPVLEANAFKPVEVRLSDGEVRHCFLRDLQIAQQEAQPRSRASGKAKA